MANLVNEVDWTMVRSNEEIQAEINTLKDLAPRIKQYDFFGGSNRKKIDLEIAVLEGKYDQDDIDNMDDPDERSAGDSALQWLEDPAGFEEATGEKTLSADWQGLVQ